MTAILTDGVAPLELPIQFSYRLPVPKKRISVVRTANSAIPQAAASSSVLAEEVINWNILAATPVEFLELYTMYLTMDVYKFIGYWDDVYNVTFNSLEKPEVRGRLFSISGQFAIVGTSNLFSKTFSNLFK